MQKSVRVIRQTVVHSVLLLFLHTAWGDVDKSMVVMGVDGMDPGLARQFMDEGIMPNLAKLEKSGGFMPLGTSVPPQSPVAWSNFITGMDSGGHGIFDFLGFDRATMQPFNSVARLQRSDAEPLEFGEWRIPLAEEKILQLRDGQTFWEILENNGVPTTILRIPANYPPTQTSGKALSGMGTPDLRGTPGLFSYFTNALHIQRGSVPGGELEWVEVQDGVVQAQLKGPPNPFRAEEPISTVDFKVVVDKQNPVALLSLGDERVLLNSGEWSRWIPLRFSLIPGVISVPGMVRFFLQQTSPDFALYASPVNIDPRDPAQVISDPPGYAQELAEAVGPFYTQEMPADTKALSAGILSPGEFLEQSALVLGESRRLLEHAVEQFKARQRRGLLFFYLSSLDQRHHMVYRHTDSSHPHHAQQTSPDLADSMRSTYREIDDLVGWLMMKLDRGSSLVVMSDHGFASFKRQANLNRWLEVNGYLNLKFPSLRHTHNWLEGIDWSKTRAFAIGLNSLYINVRGRDRFGIVEPGEREGLAREIVAGLLKWRDDADGAQVVTQPLLRESIYHGKHLDAAPDIIVGYARDYRASWATTSGKVPETLLDDNTEEWSGDHCIDSREVPGVLVSNLEMKSEDADLKDLTVSILNYFGVAPPEQLRGQSIF